MKIRIKGNTIRYRLTVSEVGRLYQEGSVEQIVEFDNRNFIYALKKSEALHLKASYIGDKILIEMPSKMVDDLANTDVIGFDGNYGKLSLLVEKDFVCLDNTLEDQQDNYPNPQLTC